MSEDVSMRKLRDTAIVSEWSLKVCEECGRRAAPHCSVHPDALPVRIKVVPKDIERFYEEVGGDAIADFV